LTLRLNSAKALSDQRILLPLKVNPRKLSWSVLATRLLASLTLSPSFRSIKRLTDAITRLPAR
jgi:hypothetical protein